MLPRTGDDVLVNVDGDKASGDRIHLSGGQLDALARVGGRTRLARDRIGISRR